MIKRLSIFFVVFFVFSLVVSLYQISKAKQRIRDTKESVLAINPVKLPDSEIVGNKFDFVWDIDAPPSFKANQTSVFYSYSSSSSALLKTDSPEAVGYQEKSTDYDQGPFYLPNRFSSTLTFGKPGTIYYRLYARINGNHLWTEERSFKVK